MEATAQRILSPKFILQELTDEIHKLLGLKYTRAILQRLENEPDGMTFREVDVKIIGSEGSPGSADSTLKKLKEVGWVENKNSSYVITKRGREALTYARQGDGLGPMEAKGRV
jgi:DNA-binding HxlR family transcriptional regulator